MKRPIFIIIGAVSVIILLAVWIYILFFAKPNEDNIFANLNFGGEEENITIPDNIQASSSEPILDINSGSRLVQLTTEPTAGYKEIYTKTSSSSLIFYVKSGTGHIFSIDLKTGEEKQLTNTTVGLTRVADITPDGKFAMLQNNNSSAVVGAISETDKTLVTEELKENITSFKATSDNTFLYTIQENSSTVGKEYYPDKKTSKVLFTVPFREAVVVWGDNTNDTHYAYPKASSRLEGYAYKINKGVIQRLPISGYGLSLFGDSDSVIYSTQVNSSYTTSSYVFESKTRTNSPFILIPEKCADVNQSKTLFVCGESITNYSNLTPDTWYQGVVSYEDALWEFDTESSIATFITDVSKESGRNIDIVKPFLSVNDERVYFMNKNDQTLWLYKRVVSNN